MLPLNNICSLFTISKAAFTWPSCIAKAWVHKPCSSSSSETQLDVRLCMRIFISVYLIISPVDLNYNRICSFKLAEAPLPFKAFYKLVQLHQRLQPCGSSLCAAGSVRLFDFWIFLCNPCPGLAQLPHAKRS